MNAVHAHPGTYARPVAQASAETRLTFIRKVYTLFATTLVIAVGGAAWTVNSPAALSFAAKNHFILWIALFAGIFGIFALRHVRVLNVLALFGFGAAMGFFAGPMIYYASITAKDPNILASAFWMTTAVFTGLSAYVFITRKDFSWMGGMLFLAFWLLIAAGLVFMFIAPSNTLYFIYLVVGTLIFSGYVLYDTSMIIHHLPENEYVSGAISLFLDFYNLFMLILALLSRRD